MPEVIMVNVYVARHSAFYTDLVMRKIMMMKNANYLLFTSGVAFSEAHYVIDFQIHVFFYKNPGFSA